MIDFRYHVVSIIAVFLALSVGLVLGSSFLGDIASKNLDKQIKDLGKTADGLRRDLTAAREERDDLSRFIDAAKPDLVQDKLKGRSVVLVTLPDADSDVTAATVKTLEESGATVTGTVAVKSAWVDPEKEAALSAAAGVPNGQTPTDRTTEKAADRAAAALAGAVVHKSKNGSGTPNPGGAPTGSTTPPATPPTGAPTGDAPTGGIGPTPTATANGGTGGTGNGNGNGSGNSDAALTVLERLKSAGFIDVKGHPEKGATLAVVVAPAGPVTGSDPARANTLYLGLSRTLDASDDGTVMAGDTASVQDGGTVAALRRDDRTAKVVSSVDAAETTAGQVSVDWALVVESEEGKSGQYGATGTDGWLPELPDATNENAGKTS
ncbi:copper transporter [Yinghuangia soli]|uniref:Copper transporter n=1 Tax=Yinghuangia soli TaxID=2908204 RepID=A0AA41U3K6_9ACTN|nr:copper transporter [Yinghuangia soli]MCF2531916.1 copper transporter [Yinghuangia soli]